MHPLTSSTVVCPPVLPFSPPFSGENQILMQKCAHMVSISGWFPWGSSAPRKITSNSTRLTRLRSTWTLSHREFDPTTEMTYTVQRLVWRMFLSSSLSSGVVSHLCSLTSPLTWNSVFLLLYLLPWATDNLSKHNFYQNIDRASYISLLFLVTEVWEGVSLPSLSSGDHFLLCSGHFGINKALACKCDASQLQLYEQKIKLSPVCRHCSCAGCSNK